MSILSVKHDTLGASFSSSQIPVPPSISGYSISGLDDTALLPEGGQTIIVRGTGFQRGATITFDGTNVPVVTWISSNELSFTSPVKSAGTYTLYIINADGGTAIYIPGIIYSTAPTWTTAPGSLGTVYETTSISKSVAAAGDAPVTYQLYSGTLPPGSTLASDGTISGSAPVESGSTTYSFTIEAIDAELQSSVRSFSLTINTDVVTWVNPSSGATVLLDGSAYSNVLSATDAAGYAVSYTADSLPTGLTLSGNTISGTPTSATTVTSSLTATAATTGRSATNTVTWVISLGDVYWKYVTSVLSANPSNTFITDSSINNAQLIPAGTVRADNANPYQVGYYSDYMNGQVYSALGAAGASFSLTGDFTIEAWVYPTSFPGGDWGVLDVRASGGTATPWVFGMQGGTNKMYFYDGTARVGATVLTPGQWYHMVWVRTGSTLKAYLNGVLDYYNASYTTAAVGPTSTSPYIGTKDYGIANFGTYGYISNLRVVNGTAMYSTTATTVGTTAFTSPTTPLTAVNNTVLLTCQSARFVDNSPTALTVTPSSSTLIATKTASPFATVYQAGTQYYSNYFDGSDRLTRAWSSEFDLGNTYTIELWAYSATASGWKVLFNTEFPLTDYFGNMAIMLRGDTGKIAFTMQQATGAGYQSSAAWLNAQSAFVKNKWYHIAVSVNAGTGTLYIDGVAQATAAIPLFIGNPAGIGIGGHYNGYNASTEAWPGEISNLRIVKGTALYTSNFVPPNSPLTAVSGTVLLTCQDNTIKDNSANNFALTVVGDAKPTTAHPYMFDPAYYSTSFDGTGDYLTVPANSALTLGTSDYTVEAWINLTGTQTTTYGWGVIGTYPGSGTGWSLTVNRSTGGQGIVWILGSSIVASYTAAYIPTNTWTHIAITRSGTGTNNTKIFLNGALVTQATDNTNDTFSGLTYIGGQGTGQLLTGYISNARVVKGTALYTSTFTPSTSPLTAISGTSLLTCQDSLIIDRSSNAFAITTNGNATPAAVAPFTQPSSYTSNQITTFGSGYFNGSTDYITSPLSPAFAVGTGDFTIEAWVYPTAANQPYSAIFAGINYGSSSDWGLYLGNGTTALYPMLQFTNSTSDRVISSVAVTQNQWSHIAVTRSGGTARIFINGAQTGTASAGAWSMTNTLQKGIGAGYNGNSSTTLTGYISNLRLINGTALYTSNFLPPVNSQLTNVTNTQLLTLQNNTNANNSGFKDSSSFNNLITRNGNTTQGTFSPYGANWSNYFDGSGDYLTVPSNAAFALPGDFTFECWFYPNAFNQVSNNGDTIYYTSVVNGLQIGRRDSAGGTGWGVASATVAWLLTSTTLPTNYTWNHIAVTRSNTTLMLWLNGVLLGSTTNSTSFVAGSVNIGSLGGTASTFINGYISNLRVIKGTALYTSNFTPSTTPLQAIAGTSLLTCQSPNIVDNSPNNFTITKAGDTSVQKFGPFAGTTLPTPYYSGYFDGSGDYLQVASNTAFGFGTGDFTIECWVYPTVNARQDWIDITNGTQRALLYYSGSAITFYSVPPNAAAITGPAMTLNTWTHIAISKQSGNTKMFVNGVQVGSTYTSNQDYGSSALVSIGKDNAGSTYVTGYMADVRVVKGTAVYTTNFTPPTTPLTAISGTSLLTCQNNTFVDNSTNNFTITAAGNAAPKQISPFTSTYSTGQSYTPAVHGGSMYFDGTGDYLSNTTAPVTDFGTGDFTVEYWLYYTSTINNNFQQHVGTCNSSTGLAFGTGPSGQLYATTYTTGYTSTGVVVPNSWQHVAWTRASGTLRGYLNGVQVYSASVTTNFNELGTGIGGSKTGASLLAGGYLSNIRVVKGQALYTSNFVPQNQPLTPVKNTTLLLSGTSAGIYDSGQVVDYETVGDARAANFGPYNGSYYSNYFDGTGDYLTLPNSSAFVFGTGSFTIEFWINAQLSNDKFILGGRAAIGSMHITTGGYNSTAGVLRYTNGTDAILSSGVVTDGNWHHCAIVRNGSSAVTLYVDGVSVGTGTDSTNYTTSVGTWYVASNDNFPGSNLFTGYLSNLRVVKGTALYTANFTPSTTPLTAVSGTSLLTCQSNKFVDNSTNNFTITKNGDTKVATQNPWQNNTGTCMYFDGTGDYLTAPMSPATTFGAGNFTVEGWVYTATNTANQDVIGLGANASAYCAVRLVLNASGQWVLLTSADGASWMNNTPSGSYSSNTWYHFAVVRNGSSFILYVNGVSLYSYTNTSALYAAGTVNSIGRMYATSPGQYLNGYISDLRITKGVARYTSSFTPPTAPFNLK